MEKVFVLLSTLVILYSSNALAAKDTNMFLGLQVGQADAEDEDLEYGLIRIGAAMSDNMTIEVRSGRGTNDTKVDNVTVEIERIYGLYTSYHFKMSEKVSAYGIAGWSKATVKASLGNQSQQEDDNGLSYGVGLEAYGVNVEWMQYLDTSDLDASAIAIGYNYWIR